MRQIAGLSQIIISDDMISKEMYQNLHQNALQFLCRTNKIAFHTHVHTN